MKSPLFVTLTASLFLSFSMQATAVAQQGNACAQENLGEPPRTVYRCANGLVIEAEAAAELGLTNAEGQPRPGAATVSENGVLIEVEPGSGPFQILTPHAIAAVRGTAYAVDVTADTTAVFVIRGEVVVSRPDGSEAVTLRPGEGADVSPAQPFTVRTWGQQRVDNLLARFGR